MYRRWHELGQVLGSAGLLPSHMYPAVHRAMVQGPAPEDVRGKLGDTVSVGSNNKGTVR